MLMVTDSGPVTVALLKLAKAGPVKTPLARVLDVEVQRVGIERRAVVEHDAGAQRDGEGREVLVGRDRLGQVRLHPAGGVHDGEGVEDGAAVEEPALVPARRRGIEPALLGIDAQCERSALFGLGGGDPVSPRPVGLGCARLPVEAADDGGPGAQCKSAGHERPAIKRLRHRKPPKFSIPTAYGCDAGRRLQLHDRLRGAGD